MSRGLINKHSDRKGIPQGTSLSPLLSNMYMANLDSAMHTWASSLSGKYWRYCDDILIVIPGNNSPAPLNELDNQLQLLKLRRSQQKTATILGTNLSTQEQLQYLGFVFNGEKVTVRSSSIHRYHRRLKKAVYAAKVRQLRESERGRAPAHFRKQALYNMYSDKPVRGKRILSRMRRRKYGVDPIWWTPED